MILSSPCVQREENVQLTLSIERKKEENDNPVLEQIPDLDDPLPGSVMTEKKSK